MRIVAENCTDIEGMVDLLQRAYRRLGLDGDKHSQAKDDDDDENNNGFLDTLQTILSRTEATRRWSMNYADRGKILIDLVGFPFILFSLVLAPVPVPVFCVDGWMASSSPCKEWNDRC